MFSGLLERLRLETKAIKDVVELHEYSREFFYSVPNTPDSWSAVRAKDPSKRAWQVYDHCAALLRLYAVYSIFLEDLVGDYLAALPDIYESYELLPEPILKQHRTGLGQILLKLGETGPYRHLKDTEVILEFSKGMTGLRPYMLLKDAFLVDRQNYRAEALGRLFANLGVAKICSRVGRHPSMTKFVTERLGDESTFVSELDNFVGLRNEAAHSPVEDTISVGRFLTIADFVLLTCELLAEIVSQSRAKCIAQRRPSAQLGVINHVYHSGKVAILKMSPATIQVGEEIMLVSKDGKNTRVAKILSIQNDDSATVSITASDGQEIGLGLDSTCREGELVRRILHEAKPSTPKETSLPEAKDTATTSTAPCDDIDQPKSPPDMSPDQ